MTEYRSHYLNISGKVKTSFPPNIYEYHGMKIEHEAKSVIIDFESGNSIRVQCVNNSLFAVYGVIYVVGTSHIFKVKPDGMTEAILDCSKIVHHKVGFAHQRFIVLYGKTEVHVYDILKRITTREAITNCSVCGSKNICFAPIILEDGGIKRQVQCHNCERFYYNGGNSVMCGHKMVEVFNNDLVVIQSDYKILLIFGGVIVYFSEKTTIMEAVAIGRKIYVAANGPPLNCVFRQHDVYLFEITI